MSENKFHHRKKRNTGLVYEFLVRRVSKAMLENDQETCKKALDIVRKYYGEGAPLAEERELFDVVKNTRGVNEATARRIMSEVQRHARSLDEKKLDIKKSNLIKEINYTFGKNFFSEHRVPEYRLLASIQMVIDASHKENRLTESVQKIQLEEGLVRYMTTRGTFTESVSQKSEIDALVMTMVAKRFQEKYSQSLTSAQKRLLEKYVRYQVTNDEMPLRQFIISETERVRKALDRAAEMKEVKNDKVMTERLSEAKAKLNRGKNINEVVEDLMLYQKLAEEIENDE